MPARYLDDDFVTLRRSRNARQTPFATLAFGDAVEVLDESDPEWTKVRALDVFDGTAEGWVRGRPPLRDEGILRLSLVDVQQGDGMVLETPKGEIVLVDGGDNQLFARHVAARFRHRGFGPERPLDVAAIVVTHGDADHFDGLNRIRRSETDRDLAEQPHKRLFLRPRRLLHNGLVKGPGALAEREIFGRTVERDGEVYIVDLHDDPRQAPVAARNRPFDAWCETLDHWQVRPEDCRRVAHGMDPADVFDFLADEGIGVEIQGPFADRVEVDGQEVAALPFLHKPKKSAEMHLEAPDREAGALSASHTINGHSIALRLTYGNVRFNLTGDLNREAMKRMRDHVGSLAELEAEIVKAPHHGSHDFDYAALAAMKPVVAIVSSGDESSRKEHIHPRATLMSALGKTMRLDTGVVFVTELAAFFEVQEESHSREELAEFFAAEPERTYTGEELRRLFRGKPKKGVGPRGYFGFARTNFGIVHLRTDGERVLAFTHSGKKGLNEAYRFTVTREGDGRRVTFAEGLTTR